MIELTIIGNVGNTRYFHNEENTVLNLSIAASRRVQGKEYTDWVSAKVWGERASKLKDLITVGQKLLIRGRPQARGYLSGNGNAVGDLIVHAREIEFIGPRPKPEDELFSPGNTDPSPLPQPTTEPKTRKPRKPVK